MDAGSALLALCLTSLAALAMLSLAGLRAWRGWLELRRERLAAGAGAPVDLAALRRRVRHLEAIASGF
jgi:hypothetical protein